MIKIIERCVSINIKKKKTWNRKIKSKIHIESRSLANKTKSNAKNHSHTQYYTVNCQSICRMVGLDFARGRNRGREVNRAHRMAAPAPVRAPRKSVRRSVFVRSTNRLVVNGINRSQLLISVTNRFIANSSFHTWVVYYFCSIVAVLLF